MSQANRGKFLEQAIEQSNTVYKSKKMALIDKVPTPWSVSYGSYGRVSSAFPQEKGTVDFIGVSKGIPIAFEAKTTRNKTRLSLDNIQAHQVRYLLDHQEQGGVSFLIVFFETHNKYYYVQIDQLNEWWISQFRGGRKSIPYNWFMTNCRQIKSKNGAMLDYLTIALEQIEN